MWMVNTQPGDYLNDDDEWLFPAGEAPHFLVTCRGRYPTTQELLETALARCDGVFTCKA